MKAPERYKAYRLFALLGVGGVLLFLFALQNWVGIIAGALAFAYVLWMAIEDIVDARVEANRKSEEPRDRP